MGVIKHQFRNLRADGPDATVVRPSDWNADHEIDPGTVGPTEADRSQLWLFEGGLRRTGGIVSPTDVADKAYVDAAVAGVGGAFSQAEKLALELEMDFKASKLLCYKEPGSYTDGYLTLVDVWETPAKLVKLFSKALSYTDGLCTQSVLTRIADGATLTKTLTYDDQGQWASTTRT